MAEIEIEQPSYTLLGGNLALDFANTVEWHEADDTGERLNDYVDVVSWSRFVGLLTDEKAATLLELAASRPEEAAATRERAVALREAVYRVFSAIAEERQPKKEDLAILNAELARALPNLRVAPGSEGFGWRWNGEETALDRMLWPISRAAAELLTSEDHRRVRKCAGHPCGWLFIDNSRNQSRRWCEMTSCGNRAKARRHYQRTRPGKSP